MLPGDNNGYSRNFGMIWFDLIEIYVSLDPIYFVIFLMPILCSKAVGEIPSRGLVYPFEYTKHARAFCTQIGLNPKFLFRSILVEKARVLVYPNWSK